MTSKKHQDFVSEPMGNKPVTAVPGVGTKIGESMTKEGISTAKQLYGEYLTASSEDNFKDTVKSHGANSKSQRDAANAMSGWDQQNN